jgi:hypothetical protein
MNGSEPAGGGPPTLERIIAGLGSEERQVLFYVAETLAEWQARKLERGPLAFELKRVTELVSLAAKELRRALIAREEGGVN